MISCVYGVFFFFKQKTAYEMRISDWSSDVCSSDLIDFIDKGTASRLRRFRFERSKEMTRILVLYYSMYGHIEQMARAIAEGAASVDGVDVTEKRVPEQIGREHV